MRDRRRCMPTITPNLWFDTEALEAAGVKVGKTPSETADLMREILKDL